ncbi:MAG TPA: trigger factor [Syntrophorhabdaceae bacterium]|nr:trigger factor [Syntrophorhabdaceae bacterium]
MMKVDIQEIDNLTKKVEVIVSDEDTKPIEDEIYNELKKQVKVKGFRPGRVPKNIINAFYKDYIEAELKKRIVESTMGNALNEVNIKPIGDPIIDFFDDDGFKGYTIECEVIPHFEPPEYKGIEVEVEPITVSEDDVKRRMENIRQLYAQMEMKSEEEGAEKDDFMIISYQGFLDGKPLQEVKTDNYPVELGNSMLMPEFESALYGMKIGEDKEITIDFPDDYPDKDICGRRILFKIHVKEIRKKILPELDDDFAKDMGFENLEKMRESVENDLRKEKESARNKIIYQKIIDSLLEKVDIAVPKRYLEKRVQSMLEEAKQRYEAEGITEDIMKNLEVNLRKDYEQKAEKRIKTDFLLIKIAEKENIKLDEKDVEERLKRIAEDARRPYNDVKSFYERNELLESLKGIILEEKTLNFLKDNAVIKETI